MDDLTAGLPKLLTPPEVARALRIDTSTVVRWCKSGEIESTKLPGRGMYRIPRSEVYRLAGIPPEPDADPEEPDPTEAVA